MPFTARTAPYPDPTLPRPANHGPAAGFGRRLPLRYNGRMIHLRTVHYQSPERAEFPFDLPLLRHLPELRFEAPVTFLVGENGSGKSTLLEALALAVGLPGAGSQDLSRDATLDPVRPLARALRLSWNRRVRVGLFLRAEDFFGYVKRLATIKAELQGEMARTEAEAAGRSAQAQALARTPFARELASLNRQYDRDLNQFSHGEGFLEFFSARFRPGGLYLLDEPEVPLSPLRQLTLLSLLRRMVAQECQFIIATHSPLLLALPEAQIWSLDEIPLRPVAYQALEHVTVTRAFLADPEQFLRHL